MEIEIACWRPNSLWFAEKSTADADQHMSCIPLKRYQSLTICNSPKGTNCLTSLFVCWKSEIPSCKNMFATVYKLFSSHPCAPTVIIITILFIIITKTTIITTLPQSKCQKRAPL